MVVRSIRPIIAVFIHLQINSFTRFLWNKPRHTAIHYRHIKTRFTSHKHIISLPLLVLAGIRKLRISGFLIPRFRINNRCGTVFVRIPYNRETPGFRHCIRIYDFLSRIVASSPTTVAVRSKTLVNSTAIFEVRENHFLILWSGKYGFVRSIRVNLAHIGATFIQHFDKIIIPVLYQAQSSLTCQFPFIFVIRGRKQRSTVRIANIGILRVAIELRARRL